MGANLSKKFALLCCCLMTMMALRLVICTAGFCAVRFHIDCELFNIFISRLVNAVMMSSLLGNWLGDLIVFAADGRWKIISAMLAIWTEFMCFCTALYSICHTEVGHLTGFYWSMVMAYFWWKVSEAPIVSIAAPDATDYYYAGFTLSGVWAAFLKGLVMRCVTAGGAKTLHFQSDVLGDVNLTVVGDRSVKTTVDYRAAKWLYIVTIVLTFFMCFVWLFAAAVVGGWNKTGLNDTNVQSVRLSDVKPKDGGTVKLSSASKTATVGYVTLTIKLTNVQQGSQGKWSDPKADLEKDVEGQQGTTVRKKIEDDVKAKLKKVSVAAKEAARNKAVDVAQVTVQGGTAGELTITLTTLGMIVGETQNMAAAALAGVAFGGVLAVPGAMLGVGLVQVCEWFKKDRCSMWTLIIFGVVGALGGFAAGLAPCLTDDALKTGDGTKWQEWVVFFKWPVTNADKGWWVNWGPMLGLGAGLVTGAVVGQRIGFSRGHTYKARLSGLWAGAFFGSFLGLWSGEIYNGWANWKDTTGFNVKADGGAKGEEKEVVSCGFFIVVFGLGTVYSIYPGMAPCSITQFKYFNIIDICILILSAIGPIVIMGADLADQGWKLGKVIVGTDEGTDMKDKGWREGLMRGAMGCGVVMTIATLICEMIVISIMQHPFSKMAQKVTTSGVLACFITIMMVSFQLTSTGIGFACVAAGGGFNDGVNNVLSTLTLWTVECTGVLGEGYLTELKKYEPGKWPTQGMGGCKSYWWWWGRAFGNAWQIWCCIGTTDLRRDIMLCKK